MPEGHFFERRKVMDLSQYLKAGYPGLYIETHEPLRAIATIGTATWKSFSWDCLRGIAERETGRVTEDILDPLGAIKWLSGSSETVLLVQNFHHFFTSVEIIQGIQNSIPSWKASGCCLAMVGPPVRIPPEISSFFTILDFRLPSRDELRLIQEELGKSVGVESDEDSIDAALGLTEFESETAFALSLVQEKKFSSQVITGQKMQMIRRTGLMEFWPPVPEEMVGGLDLLKQYLRNRRKAFEPGESIFLRPGRFFW